MNDIIAEKVHSILDEWNLDREPDPSKPLEPNVPTPEGRALGTELARFTETELTRLKQRFPNHREPCHECAYRSGTLPNGCPETVMDALKCALEGIPFHCHLGMKDGEPTRLCTGWMILQPLAPPTKGA